MVKRIKGNFELPLPPPPAFALGATAGQVLGLSAKGREASDTASRLRVVALQHVDTAAPPDQVRGRLS
jgi:hypothetical protein